MIQRVFVSVTKTDVTSMQTLKHSHSECNHISETDLDDYPFEYIIENDGTRDDLEKKVLRVFVCIFYNLMTH